MFPLQNILVPLGVFAMVVLILWFSHVTRRRAQEQRAEIIRRMIEKFSTGEASTGEAFAQAIQGPVGSKLASALALESEKPSKKWKGLFVPASILTFMGFGFSILALVRDEDFLIPAVIIGAVGVALAVSTYVMWRAEERDGEESGGANANGRGNMRVSADVDSP